MLSNGTAYDIANDKGTSDHEALSHLICLRCVTLLTHLSTV